MPFEIDYDPRRLKIRERASQDQSRIIQTITRLRQLRQISAYLQRRLNGESLTSAELSEVDDFNRTNLILNAVLTQARALLLDNTKTEIDYEPVDAETLYNGAYIRPSFWTNNLYATADSVSELQSEVNSEISARQEESSNRIAADANLQDQIDTQVSDIAAKFTFPSGGSTSEYIDGTGARRTFPTLGTAAAQNSTAFDAAGSSASAQAFSIQRANHTGAQAISTIAGLQAALDGKFPIPVGTTAQYLRGDGTLAAFPSIPAAIIPATATPLVDGTAAVGTSTKYAREDHVHPLSGVINGGSAATTAILLGTGGTVDLTVPLRFSYPDTNYQAVASLTNAPVSILGQVMPTIKTKNVGSVVVTLKNNALATLAIGLVVDVVAFRQ